MTKLEDLARRTSATLCLGCGKCTGVCPLSELRESYSPRRLVARALNDREPEATELVRQCLTCGACEELCPEGVAFVDFVRGAREATAVEERASCPHHEILQQATRLMAQGKSREDRLSWLTPDLKVAKKGKVLLFVGCAPLFDTVFSGLGVETVEIARSAIRLLNRIGIEPVVRSDEVCCGHDLFWSGDREGFLRLAERNAAMIRESGAETVVTACAECARTLTKDYPGAAPGFAAEVKHITSFLMDRIEELGLYELSDDSFSGQTVTFQDPCRLGRHLGMTEPPRTMLGAVPGLRIVEMERSGRAARCCGTSGFQHCDAESREMQTRRLEEAAATGAETLVTACPKCLIHFTCALREDASRPRFEGGAAPRRAIRITDITTLVSSALAGRTRPVATQGEGR
ncbi:MAG: (Fe-S)-binding protein [Candidatus Eisenbacteria bacterium]|nr:(Fe-S)-binding protein [Candidatus Eisenbacteria bacterium]